MSKKNRFQSNFNRDGQPVVEEENMEQEKQSESVQDQQAESAPVAQETAQIEEVVQAQAAPVVQAKPVQAEKDPTVVEHTKVNQNVKVEATKQPVEKISTDNSSQAIIEKAHKATDTFTVGLVNFLDSYMKKMSPGLLAGDKQGGMTQFNLHNTIVQLFNAADYDVFRNGLLILLAYFNAYEKGVFNERYLFRFSEQWPGGADKLTNFHATLNLLKIIANKQERPVGKFISLERTFNTGYTELAKDNISRFLKTA